MTNPDNVSQQRSHNASADKKAGATQAPGANPGWRITTQCSQGHWVQWWFSRKQIADRIAADVDSGVSPITGQALEGIPEKAIWKAVARWAKRQGQGQGNIDSPRVCGAIEADPESNTPEDHSPELRSPGDS